MEEALAAGTVLRGAVSCELGERRDEGEEAACGDALSSCGDACAKNIVVGGWHSGVGEQPGCLGDAGAEASVCRHVLVSCGREARRTS
jgi:hypothetical protein